MKVPDKSVSDMLSLTTYVLSQRLVEVRDAYQLQAWPQTQLKTASHTNAQITPPTSAVDTPIAVHCSVYAIQPTSQQSHWPVHVCVVSVGTTSVEHIGEIPSPLLVASSLTVLPVALCITMPRAPSLSALPMSIRTTSRTSCDVTSTKAITRLVSRASSCPILGQGTGRLGNRGDPDRGDSLNPRNT